jgi:hypothetical protein
MEKLREHLLELLSGGHAHVTFEAAVKGMPQAMRGKRPKGTDHSPWELLEHLRIAQWDILEFVRNPKHVSPEFPAGYWPKTKTPPDDAAWNKSVKAFRRDSAAIAALVKDEANDLLAPIPYADGKTFLRAVLLAADHNAYHLGQLVQLRRLLGAWPA